VLDPEDSRHALRVLRLGVGDACEVVVTPADRGSGSTEGRGAPAGERGGVAEGPEGTAYLATVTQVTGEVRVELVARLEGRQAGARYATTVGIVQALTRPAATDYLLEKGTEVGASFFFLVPVAGSTLRSGSLQGARLTRWRRIAREAAKQSKQLAVPPVEALGSIEEALDRLGPGALSLVLEPGAPGGLYDAVATAWARGGPAEGARAAQRPPGRPARLVLWVGPESGWTAEELEQLTAAGADTVRLGQSVLRAETAGPVAVAVARLALGDW